MKGSVRGGKFTPAGRGGSWIRPDKRLAIHMRDGFECVYCSKDIFDDIELQLDHYKRVQDGGTNEATNLVTCCRSCNSSKKNLTIRQWYRYLRETQGVNTRAISQRAKRWMAKDLAPYRLRAKRKLDENRDR